MIVCADARALPLRDECVQCCVTSPPYWALRKYVGAAGEIGNEGRLGEYVAHLVAAFREVRRVLKRNGTAWVVLGDTYFSGPKGPSSSRGVRWGYKVPAALAEFFKSAAANRQPQDALKPKDLCGVPWRVALALQENGWYLRQAIIWHKENCMPESSRDRFTNAHDYIFLLAKSQRYYFDTSAAAEPCSQNTHARRAVWAAAAGWATEGKKTAAEWCVPRGPGGPKLRPAGSGIRNNGSFARSTTDSVESRRMRSVWQVPARPYHGPHFATFPLELAYRAIAVGSKPGDLVLDCFAGSGTVGEAAMKLGREPVLIDLGYQALQRERMGLWAQSSVCGSEPVAQEASQ